MEFIWCNGRAGEEQKQSTVFETMLGKGSPPAQRRPRRTFQQADSWAIPKRGAGEDGSSEVAVGR